MATQQPESPSSVEILLIAAIKQPSTSGNVIALIRPKYSDIYHVHENDVKKYHIELGDFCYASISGKKINWLKKTLHNDGIVLSVQSDQVYASDIVAQFSVSTASPYFTTKAFGRVAPLKVPERPHPGPYSLRIRPLKYTEKQGRFKNFNWVAEEYKLLNEGETRKAFVVNINMTNPNIVSILLWMLVEHELAVLECKPSLHYLNEKDFVEAVFRRNVEPLSRKFTCVDVKSIIQPTLKLTKQHNFLQAEVVVYLYWPADEKNEYPRTYHPKFGNIFDNNYLLPTNEAHNNRIKIRNGRINNKFEWVIIECETF